MLEQIAFILNKVYGLVWEIPKILQVCNLEILHTICLGFKHGYCVFLILLLQFMCMYMCLFICMYILEDRRGHEIS